MAGNVAAANANVIYISDDDEEIYIGPINITS
jgi:hypothetical protein